MTLEVILNTMNGVIYGTTFYLVLQYPAIVRPTNPFATFLGFVSIMALANLVANVGKDVYKFLVLIRVFTD